MVNIDIFSCEDFDAQETIIYAQTMFQTDDVEIHAVERALRSPRMSTKLAMQR
jgi:S-adenosylmethionine/arginine decarboxylase-like enzyme